MNGNTEAGTELKKVRHALAAGIGVLAMDGAIIALAIQDKISDVAIIYHIPPVLSGLTLVAAAAMRLQQIRHN